MKTQVLLPIAAAAFAAAQDNGDSNDVSLTDALASKNDTLSTLGGLLTANSALVDTLSQAQNITILAPSNDALEKLLDNEEVTAMIAADPGLIAAILSYHVLNGTYYADDITENPAFVPTMLMNETYSNVTGGQVVEAMKEDDTVSFISGLRMKSNVTEANLNFTGGVIHIINEVLTLPMNLTATAQTADLRALVGAVTQLDLASDLDGLKDVTVFAPSDSAFANIGSAVGNLSEDDLKKILSYHIVTEGVFYSSDIMDDVEAETSADEDVNISVDDGSVFVNGAKVIVPDILFAGGVIHVIDQVLNPDNSDQEPNASVEPAFSGASTATDGAVPFTSGVPTPTNSDAAENFQPEESGRAGSGQTGGGSGGGSNDGGDNEGGSGNNDEDDAGARPAIGAALGAVAAGVVLMVNLM